MTWKTRLSPLKPGDKVKCISNRNSGSDYEVGKTYVLKNNYMKDGLWCSYNTGGDYEKGCNYWDTTEHKTIGIKESDFKRC